MTFAQGLLLALLRAAIIALYATAIGWCIRQTLASSRTHIQKLFITSLLLIYLTPTLTLGYTYSVGSLSLARYPIWNDILYAALLCLKLLPVAVALLAFIPSPALSAEAAFLRRLAPPGSVMSVSRFTHAVSFLVRGPLRNPIVTCLAIFLLAFHDFELAALMNVAAGRTQSAYTWTIALHEARQLNVPAGDILMRAVWPVLIEAVVLIAGLTLLWRTGTGAAAKSSGGVAPNRAERIVAWSAVLLAFAAVCALPGFIIMRGAVTGIGELFRAFRFGDELLASFYFAAGATGVVMFLVGCVKAWRRRTFWTSDRENDVHITGASAPSLDAPYAILLLCIPGLLGALVLGMTLMALFQFPLLRNLYDTPVPLVLGLSLLVLPIAVLLRWCLDVNRPAAGEHLASMLRASSDAQQHHHGRALMWSLHGRSTFLLAAFVFFFCYLELVLSVTLAPIAMTPAIVEFYNQMHYGQRALLSALTAVTVLTPLVVLAVAWLGLGAFRRLL